MNTYRSAPLTGHDLRTFSALLVAGLVGACGSGVGCSGPVAPDPPGTPVPLSRFTDSPGSFNFYSGFERRERLVVRDAATWERVWNRIWERHSPTPERPQVDFTREMVLVAALGQRPTGGYTIVFESAGATSDELTVLLRTTSPGNCGVTLALTQPVDLARVQRSDGRVLFEERAEVIRCP